MFNSKIIGVGSYVPENIVYNDDLKKIVDTSDEWISSRTGIKQRRISTGEETSDLAAKAGLNALEMAGIQASDLDYIIVATMTPDKYTPSTASIVQDKIKAINASALDINAACTGFVYTIEIANSLIKSGVAKNILVIGSETLSRIVDWNDRGTCVLFGDGAGAAILTRTTDENIGIRATVTGSDGSKGMFLTSSNITLNNPFIESEEIHENYIKMNGGEVFKFATRIMEDSILEVIKKANLKLEDISHIIPHQANYRIIDYVSRKLSLNLSKFIINLDRYGNTSSASIPIALNEAVRQNKFNKGDNIVLVGFGGGLTWGAVLIKY